MRANREREEEEGMVLTCEKLPHTIGEVECDCVLPRDEDVAREKDAVATKEKEEEARKTTTDWKACERKHPHRENKKEEGRGRRRGRKHGHINTHD